MAALAVLGGFFIWGRYDAKVTAEYLEKYQPTPLPDNPSFCPQDDVSIVVCTLDPPKQFVPCLRRWLANNPLEVIISTTVKHIDEVREIVHDAGLTEMEMSKIRFVRSSEQGCRLQFIAGVNIARGTIIARSDDHITWHPEFLTQMLAPLEDSHIGAVLPTMTSWIPEERRNPQSTTPSEVAITRALYNRNPGVKSLYAGHQWAICLVGLSFLIRADIVRDPSFQHAFLHDYWHGGIIIITTNNKHHHHHLDAGDDTFLTRWLQARNATIAVQATPQTTVERTVKRTAAALVSQMLRWERSSIQSFVRTLWEVPQIWRRPYVARKTLERVFRPVLTWIHVWAWVSGLRQWPWCTLALMLWYVWLAVPGHVAFYQRYPWMVRYWWAGVLVDFCYLVQEPWCWLTLHDTTWKRGEAT